MEKVFNDLGDFNGICVLPPYPRKMGTYVPSSVQEKSFELESISFTQQHRDSHTALALQTALLLGSRKIYVIGYDGYQDVPVLEKERALTNENEYLFSMFSQKEELEVYTLTASNYKSLVDKPLYSLL